MKMKIEYYIGAIESMFYQRQFVYYMTASENNRKITSLTLKWKGRSLFRHHSNQGTMDRSEENLSILCVGSVRFPLPCILLGVQGRAHFYFCTNCWTIEENNTKFSPWKILPLLVKESDSREHSPGHQSVKTRRCARWWWLRPPPESQPMALMAFIHEAAHGN